MSHEAYLKGTIVYMNGAYVPYADATVSIASAPVQYGLAVYTALTVCETPQGLVGFRIRDHYLRLVRSARILGMKDMSETLSYAEFCTMVRQLIHVNNCTTKTLVRITYYIDASMAGTKIHDQPVGCAAFLLPYGDYFSKLALDVCVSSWRRVSDGSVPPRAKITGSYVNASLMKSEALINGYDDCIALDTQGHVAEGAVANVFLVKDGQLHTPSVATDILEGITRDTVISIAKQQGIEVHERTIDRTELYTADEVFFSGSSARIWPIASIDKRPVGNRTVGRITRAMQQWYEQVQKQEYILDTSWYERISE